MTGNIGKPEDRVRGESAWRIDSTSNYGDETYAESVKLSWLTESQANRIAEILNEGDTESRTYYKPRPHGHRLWRGMEELV